MNYTSLYGREFPAGSEVCAACGGCGWHRTDSPGYPYAEDCEWCLGTGWEMPICQKFTRPESRLTVRRKCALPKKPKETVCKSK